MAKRTAHTPLELDTQGASLTDFAQATCPVQQVTFPLCLVAASCLRPPVRPRLGDIPAWPLRQIPDALFQCSVDMPSGLTLWPFADDPHITQEGFILHGPNAEIRAKVYRFLLQREIPSNVAPSVREHLEWHHENGSLIKIFTFRSLEHLTLQAFPPPSSCAHLSTTGIRECATRTPCFCYLSRRANMSVRRVCSAGRETTGPGRAQRFANAGTGECVSPPAFPESRSGSTAQGDGNLAKHSKPATHYPKSPTCW